MPHIGHDATEAEVDYSAFEHQHFLSSVQNNGGNSEAIQHSFQMDPLEDRGGLDGDQVAELVGMRVFIQASPDDLEGIIGNDTSEGSFEYRGLFGVDLDGNTDQWYNADGVDGTPNGALDTETDPAVLDQFDVTGIAPFSNSTAGLGGGGSTPNLQYMLNFRELTGRGPVLDAADNLTVVGNLIKNQVSSVVEASYGGALTWDVSTIEGDRRQFSVP